MRAVLKIGGSLLYEDDGQVRIDRLREYAILLKSLVKDGHSLVVVVGGGKPARSFISAARELGASEAQCDWLGIKLARNNAELLSAALGDLAYPKIIDDYDELEVAVNLGKIVLLGGMVPGQSTNAVAAASAELVHADMLFNATNVDGVYDRNPEEKGAKKLDTVDVGQLREILSTEGTKAGQYNLFDPVAIGIVERSQIPTVIFNGNNPENLKKAFNKEKIGTRIMHNTNG
ncbi:MAG: Uridylate kinase [Candidatus Thorarchaeota archaeon AB_25]|nr:MAG: Uridylate kinase [Candidatus Thorarchaeota archaeon AB_25]